MTWNLNILLHFVCVMIFLLSFTTVHACFNGVYIYAGNINLPVQARL